MRGGVDYAKAFEGKAELGLANLKQTCCSTFGGQWQFGKCNCVGSSSFTSCMSCNS